MKHRIIVFTLLSIALLPFGLVSYGQAGDFIKAGRNSVVRVGFTQAIVPFGISSDKPGPLFSDNDFTIYIDEEYGFNTEYQFFATQPFGLQFGGFYYYAKESDRVNNVAVDASNFMTLEGGGVYCGVTWKAGLKNIGVRTSLNLGYFTFDYRMKLVYKTQFMTGFLTEYRGEAISGAGSRIDAGLYGEIGRFGVYPSLQILYIAKNGPSALILKTLNISAGYRF
jgi:hypothetical protein